MNLDSRARELLIDWKGEKYSFGPKVLESTGKIVKNLGDRVVLVTSSSKWTIEAIRKITRALSEYDISFRLLKGVRPNCPLQDLYRISLQISKIQPEIAVAFGGGSIIDGVKAATILVTYSKEEVEKALNYSWSSAGSIDPFFGTGKVTRIAEYTRKEIMPMVAIQAASSSAAHLTKYSNITDPVVGQKKLIVDDLIVPNRAIFDYEVTVGAPVNLTLDGGQDGISHSWEVFMGATGKEYYEKVKEIANLSISLIVKNLRRSLEDDLKSKVSIGLGTDLGGYSIMIGGTNGPHLGSFSLVDILSHGRACAILLPYYTAFFAPSIQDQLITVGRIYQKEGYIPHGKDLKTLSKKKLGKTVASGMMKFNQSLGFPITLIEAGAKQIHIKRMLNAAKNPQLEMKLQNMPIPLSSEEGDIDFYMKGILKASFTGDLGSIVYKEI